MSGDGRTFMDTVRGGDAEPEDIDDWIDRWNTNPNPFGEKLHDFLGLTWDEYKRWVETSRLPRFLGNGKACGAPAGSRWGYLPCGCTHDGYGGHLR